MTASYYLKVYYLEFLKGLKWLFSEKLWDINYEGNSRYSPIYGVDPDFDLRLASRLT